MYWESTYHVHQRDVHEEAGGQGEYPHGDVFCVMANEDASDHAQVGHHGRQYVVQDGLLHCHSCLQQHSKVTYKERGGGTRRLKSFGQSVAGGLSTGPTRAWKLTEGASRKESPCGINRLRNNLLNVVLTYIFSPQDKN